jgi:cell shape-determining protein MreD
MFNRLRNKWNVSWQQFILIFITFAVGGSLCGYAGRKLLALFSVDIDWLRVVLYIVLVTILWPFCVLLVSMPLGQFYFFKNYLSKLFRRLIKREPVKQPR